MQGIYSMVTLGSLRHAFKGLRAVVSRERNARIHLGFALLAVLASWFFKISIFQLSLVILAIILVFFAEITNTAVERTLDLITTERNQVVQLVKDMTAGGVFVCALGALAIGVCIFGPRIYEMLVR